MKIVEKRNPFLKGLDATIERDLILIKNHIMCKLNNGNYIRFNKTLNATSVINTTKESYIKFWTALYAKDKELQKLILNALNEKLNNGLISKDEMIHLIKNSKEQEKEKEQILKLLEGKRERGR